MKTIEQILAETPDSYTCELHGEYATKCEDRYRIQLDCPSCDQEAGQAQRRLDREWRRRWAWEKCGLPHRYRNRTFANWEPKSKSQQKVLAAIQAYAANLKTAYDDGRGIVVAGDVGTGKTHLVAALTHDIIRRGFECAFVSVADLFAEIKRGFGKGNDEFDTRELQDVAFLVLDDLGASRGTEWETSVLHELLCSRYDATLPTIVTTNITNLEQVVGVRIADRFTESMVRITVAGSSQRSVASAVIGPDGIPEPPREITVKVCQRGEQRDRTLIANGLQEQCLRPLAARRGE